jgi:hypothetical protein
MIHELKTLPIYFEEVIEGGKSFEVRKNDRNFKVGDMLALNEYDAEKKEYTGNSCLVYVDYILDSVYCDECYVIMSIKPCSVYCHNRPFNELKIDKDYSVPYATRKGDNNAE